MKRKFLGNKIKNYRKSQGLSLQSVAENIGKTKSYMSMIENSKAVPSLSTLRDIATCLGITIADFFDEETNNSSKVFRETFQFDRDAKVIHSKKNEYNLYLLIRNPIFKMKTYLVELLPFGGYSQGLRHEGQEQGFVLEGQISLYLDNKEHVLNKGDYFYFYSDKKHKVTNKSEEKAKIYWVYLHE
ncbi:MAG: cupin domain-containing protein [Flexistipes sinusarabici]|uniref:Cupin domain-containing protein n=1 Tax=Flexistipes sinusarabici TaxID=2352 RepID=A0A5D0MG99_FLESI|nr:cupin domain-containing protein [Flexistipes sinusarabici]TYB32734.1 MAG: cupin domain-containing protein [Flexistipes sinusarabici]